MMIEKEIERGGEAAIERYIKRGESENPLGLRPDTLGLVLHDNIQAVTFQPPCNNAK